MVQTTADDPLGKQWHKHLCIDGSRDLHQPPVSRDVTCRLSLCIPHPGVKLGQRQQELQLLLQLGAFAQKQLVQRRVARVAGKVHVAATRCY